MSSNFHILSKRQVSIYRGRLMLAMMTTMSETRGRRMLDSGKDAMKQSETKAADGPLQCLTQNHSNWFGSHALKN